MEARQMAVALKPTHELFWGGAMVGQALSHCAHWSLTNSQSRTTHHACMCVRNSLEYQRGHLCETKPRNRTKSKGHAARQTTSAMASTKHGLQAVSSTVNSVSCPFASNGLSRDSRRSAVHAARRTTCGIRGGCDAGGRRGHSDHTTHACLQKKDKFVGAVRRTTSGMATRR